MLFAGLNLHGKWGISSEDVIIVKKLLILGNEQQEPPPIIFLPTVAHDTRENPSLTRIYIAKYSSALDYLAVSRPFSFSLEEVLTMAKRLREKFPETKIVASMAPSKLSELKALSSNFSNLVDAYEVDLGLMSLLHQYPRSFQAYAVDMLEEFVSIAPKTVLAKVTPNIPFSRDLLELLVETGINGVIFSPHPIYTIGRDLFRLHSPLLSIVYASLWAGLIAGLEVSTAFISDRAPTLLTEHDIENAYDLLLYDTALVFKTEIVPSNKIGPLPLKWANISPGMVPAVDVEKEPFCQHVCPLQAFKQENSTTLHTSIVTANKNCDNCGLCLSLCETARLIRELSPED
jgi:NAD-dependent dihydropyrimidine dehydrogenase PreA subunit